MGRPILTPQEMRLAEQAVFGAGVDSFVVMQRAGEAVSEFLHQHWPDGVVQVLCGPGGNGGNRNRRRRGGGSGGSGSGGGNNGGARVGTHKGTVRRVG